MQATGDIATLMKILIEQNEFLHQENSKLKAQISELEAKLLRYEHPKNSGNSSTPPSQDPFRLKQTESLREKSGRKQGGQQGHPGNSLEFSDKPDEVIDHRSEYYSVCGRDLSSIETVFVGKRQIIDIPPIVPRVTEHRIYSRQCSCGHCQVSDYPQEVHSSVCYGNNLLGLTAYLHSRQYIPFERMQEMYRDLFGLGISSGTLVSMVQRFADKVGGLYEIIRERIAQSPVVGCDETGVCVKGKNQWGWTFQTPKATFIVIDSSRGKKVIDKHFNHGFPSSTMVHDCWKPYFKVTTQTHQICTAHLLRELKYLDQLYGNEWTKKFTCLLNDALRLKKELTPSDYLKPIGQRKKLEQRLDELINLPLDPKYEKLITFKNRITDYRKYLFRFLYQYDVPPDNNASERAVRTFKVKQKVSGLFRSFDGAQAFAVIRSVIDTTIKNGQNVWYALNCGAAVAE
ncbi:MAG: IS66 family transposase [Candidatus Azobacteroides sp.]|nr:IS66 family transposase [Candidatus Azobacteroides sp.]